jgi:hypothetical protein
MKIKDEMIYKLKEELENLNELVHELKDEYNVLKDNKVDYANIGGTGRKI